MAIQVLSEFIS